MPATKLLIPVKSCEKTRGNFRWPDKPTLAAERESDVPGIEQLAADLKKRLSARAKIARNAFGPASVRIRRAPDVEGDEAYRLEVTSDGVEIHASGDAGAYYGVQTLRDLLAIHGGKLPCCRIDDAPDFPRRAVYHDCARGKIPKLDTLKDFVVRLAHWKINELQVYIENAFTWVKHPKIGKGFSPLKPSDLVELAAFCERHHVRLVGSLASFGHMEKTLKLPEYQHLAEMPGYRDLPGGTTLNPLDPGSIELMADLYEEFVPLHPPVDFNACCDETWELGRGRSKKRADKVGVGRVYLEFLLKLHKLLAAHGKRMNVWADIVLEHPELLDELPDDMVMCNWDYNAEGARIPRTKEIAKAGMPLVVCPGTSGWNTHGTRLANAMGNIANFAAEGRKHGAEGLLNTNWGDNGHRQFLGVCMHGFAYGAAQSWHGEGVRDRDFTKRYCRQVFEQDDDRLASAVTDLGMVYETCGADHGNAGATYFALVEPLESPDPENKTWIDRCTRPGLRKVISRLEDPGIWPEPHRGLEEFEKRTLREYAMAARMDVLAAQRALLGKDIRDGRPVESGYLIGLADDMRRLAGDFKTMWLARNRPSRLRDNMTLFRQAEKDARKHAKQGG